MLRGWTEDNSLTLSPFHSSRIQRLANYIMPSFIVILFCREN